MAIDHSVQKTGWSRVQIGLYSLSSNSVAEHYRVIFAYPRRLAWIARDLDGGDVSKHSRDFNRTSAFSSLHNKLYSFVWFGWKLNEVEYIARKMSKNEYTLHLAILKVHVMQLFHRAVRRQQFACTAANVDGLISQAVGLRKKTE